MEDNRTMRLGLYRKIEVARKQLPYMDEDAFRGLLRSEFGVESRKDMSVSQLSRLAHHFARLGVEYKAPSKIRRIRKRATPATAAQPQQPPGLGGNYRFHVLCAGKTANFGHLAQAGLFHDQS